MTSVLLEITGRHLGFEIGRRLGLHRPRSRRKSGSHRTPRWREMHSKPSVPAMEARDIFVLAAKFTILLRSAPGRSASLSSLDTGHEPGEFSIQAPLLILDTFALSFR